jgi:Flp pilus assembly pilin Flp
MKQCRVAIAPAPGVDERTCANMKHLLQRFWKDQQGAETAEWVLIVALLALVAFVIYSGILQPQLQAAVNAIGNVLQNAAS